LQFYTSTLMAGPAHVAQLSKQSGAMCSRAWCAQWLGFKPQPRHIHLPKNYFK